jgi:predicted nucleic acid-binding protein
VKHPDLLIAAAAEAADVAVLHYDEDYDRIAAITGQPTRWLAPKGTLR